MSHNHWLWSHTRISVCSYLSPLFSFSPKLYNKSDTKNEWGKHTPSCKQEISHRLLSQTIPKRKKTTRRQKKKKIDNDQCQISRKSLKNLHDWIYVCVCVQRSSITFANLRMNSVHEKRYREKSFMDSRFVAFE